MRRFVRWVPFVVAAVEVGLVGTGVLAVSSALLVVITIEVLLGIVLLATGVSAVRAVRRQRGAGGSLGQALAAALHETLPPRVARLILMEARTSASLWYLVTGRRPFPPASVELRYGRQLRPLLIVLIPISLLEIAVVELLVPLMWLRIVLLVASLYFVFWLLGLVASMTVRPHTVADKALTIRCMTFAAVGVPLDRLVSVMPERVGGMKRSVVLEDDTLTVSIMGSANLTLGFASPVALMGDGDGSATRVRLSVDDLRGALELLRPLCVPGENGPSDASPRPAGVEPLDVVGVAQKWQDPRP